MKRFLLMCAIPLIAIACKKSNNVQVDEGPSGNNDQTLPECPGGVAPASRGAAMVHVGKLGGGCSWIDETEVTRSQYQEFLTEVEGKSADTFNVALCTGKNDSLSPSSELDMTRSSHPMAGVDWCDAAAYCAWAGKSLCGSYTTATGSKWSTFETTCTDGEDGQFDYARLKSQGTCNGGGASSDSAPVKSFGGCVSPTLVFDLVGNVAEWTADCDGDGFESPCAARGGSYLASGEQWGCKARQSFPRTAAGPYLGFRCCAEDPGRQAPGT